MFNKERLDVAPKIFAPDFVDQGHESMAEKAGGPDGFANFVKAVRVALPDIKATIQTMVAEGDYVAMWNTATATHRGELFGMPPSGKPITMKDFHFFRFRDGKDRRALEPCRPLVICWFSVAGRFLASHSAPKG